MLNRFEIYLYAFLWLKCVKNKMLGFPRIFMKMLPTNQFWISPALQTGFCYLILLFFENSITTHCNNLRWNRTRIRYNELCILHWKYTCILDCYSWKGPYLVDTEHIPILNFAAWLCNMVWQQITNYYSFVSSACRSRWWRQGYIYICTKQPYHKFTFAVT